MKPEKYLLYQYLPVVNLSAIYITHTLFLILFDFKQGMIEVVYVLYNTRIENEIFGVKAARHFSTK